MKKSILNFILAFLLLAGSTTMGYAQNTIIINKTKPVYNSGVNVLSPNKKYAFSIRVDGNIIILDISSNKIIWSVPFDKGWDEGNQDKGSVSLQSDCNLCFLNNKSKKWCAMTQDKPCKELVFTNDGQLVLYGTSDEKLWTSPLPEKAPEKTIAIGDKIDEGIVFYIFKPGDPGYKAGQTGGLIAAKNDLPTALNWDDAKKTCADLGNGWKLPTKDELNKLHQIKEIVGGFATNGSYWSSSEYDSGQAWYQMFITGDKPFDVKNNTFRVRAVRAFSVKIGNAPEKTIIIGTQQWMAKNLDVATYKNGDPIPQVTDPKAWEKLTTGAWCYYNNDPKMGDKYGKLYNWYAVNDNRGLAPEGWHIPTDAEWTTLEEFLGGTTVAGGKMKETGTAHWNRPNADATNTSKFTGLPGGYRSSNGSFNDVSKSGSWWSVTEGGTALAWVRDLSYGYGRLFRSSSDKQNGFSVRCLRD